MHCPRCVGSDRDVVRDGTFPFREFRDILAPQKYRCTRCNRRWLAWPSLYRRSGLLARALRRFRSIFGGRGDWGLP